MDALQPPSLEVTVLLISGSKNVRCGPHFRIFNGSTLMSGTLIPFYAFNEMLQTENYWRYSILFEPHLLDFREFLFYVPKIYFLIKSLKAFFASSLACNVV